MGRLKLDIPTELGDRAERRARETPLARTDGSGGRPTIVRWFETWAL